MLQPSIAAVAATAIIALRCQAMKPVTTPIPNVPAADVAAAIGSSRRQLGVGIISLAAAAAAAAPPSLLLLPQPAAAATAASAKARKQEEAQKLAEKQRKAAERAALRDRMGRYIH